VNIYNFFFKKKISAYIAAEFQVLSAPVNPVGAHSIRSDS